jgi:transposase
LEPHEVLILDNARIHHAAAVKEKIAQLNRPVRYLPAYTPQLNPIENIFAEIKSKFLSRREENEMTSGEVEDLIKDSIFEMERGRR